MDASDLAAVVRAGEQLFAFKLLMTSVHCLWMYDYFLTLGDEIQYAWSGMKSWIFVLFIANRYTPVLHLTWIFTTMFHYTKPLCVSTLFSLCTPTSDPYPIQQLDSCQDTKWLVILHSSAVAILAQIAVALRIYAMTERNKLLGGTLALLIAAHVCFEIFSTIWVALRPLQPLPEINLDVFEVCIYKRWRPGELVYYNLTILFDVLAFSIILATARRPGMRRYPGVSSLLDTILRDATQYFMLIFFVQLVAELFLFVAPEAIQLLPGAANTIFVPIMASRLMLSLKKASVDPKLWSLETMSTVTQGRLAEDGTIYFASPGGSYGMSRTFTVPNGEEIELEG